MTTRDPSHFGGEMGITKRNAKKGNARKNPRPNKAKGGRPSLAPGFKSGNYKWLEAYGIYVRKDYIEPARVEHIPHPVSNEPRPEPTPAPAPRKKSRKRTAA